MNCEPCEERAGRIREAYKVIAGTPMCRECFSGTTEWDKAAQRESRIEGWTHRDVLRRGAKQLK